MAEKKTKAQVYKIAMKKQKVEKLKAKLAAAVAELKEAQK